MTEISRMQKVPVMLSEKEIQAIENFRFERRIPSRSAASRSLARPAPASLISPLNLTPPVSNRPIIRSSLCLVT
jgi:hypothetical protein